MKQILTKALAKMGLAEKTTPLKVGDEAPRVKGFDQDGEPVDLGEAYDQGPVLLFFFPKAGSPGCTNQVCSLCNAYEKLHRHGVRIFGVSADNREQQQRFRDRNRVPFKLLPDPDGEIIRAFHVPRIAQFAMRQTFLVKDGKIAWRDLAASTSKQAEDVLDILEAQPRL